MILSFRTEGSGQAVQTLIRLLLEEQSDQVLHCLLCHLNPLGTILCCKANLLELKGEYSNILGVRKFKTFTVVKMFGLTSGALAIDRLIRLSTTYVFY